MTKNKKLNKAKNLKNDEFYTLYSSIEKELIYYHEQLKDKTIYLNCDNPKYSEFYKYFKNNFNIIKPKRVITTFYNPDGKSYKTELIGKEETKTPLIGDGDFRSEECINILKESDIVITNPPFSLFRDFIALLMEYEKSFLIIGNKNAVKYKEIFPLFMKNEISLGHNVEKGTMFFKSPYSEDLKSIGSYWFTNLNSGKVNDYLIMDKTYNKADYPLYDNYPAIEVSKVKNIPKDYDGIMGVPITFLNIYNPNQFEILGMTDRANSSSLRTKKYTVEDDIKYNDLNASCVLKIGDKYKSVYTRILIKRKD